jgi:hypothetical protein
VWKQRAEVRDKATRGTASDRLKFINTHTKKTQQTHLSDVGSVGQRDRRRVRTVPPPFEHVLFVWDVVGLVARFERRLLIDADDPVGAPVKRGQRGVRL